MSTWIRWGAFSTLLVAAGYGRGAVTYVTDFAKTNNIYTSLNKEFPHSGTGTPGSGMGTPNSSFFFDPSPAAVAAAGYAPDYIAGSNLVNNGIDFTITSDGSGHDFAEISQTPLNIATNAANVQTVYLLAGAYFGQSMSVTVTGADGTSQSFNSITIPDFNGGQPINKTGGGVSDQTLFQVHDVGGGGTGNSNTGALNDYNLTEVGLTLEPALADQPLKSISVASAGNTILIYGVTLSSVPEPGTLGVAVLAGAGLLARRRRSRQ